MRLGKIFDCWFNEQLTYEQTEFLLKSDRSKSTMSTKGNRGLPCGGRWHAREDPNGQTSPGTEARVEDESTDNEDQLVDVVGGCGDAMAT